MNTVSHQRRLYCTGQSLSVRAGDGTAEACGGSVLRQGRGDGARIDAGERELLCGRG
jgi:hypothetical protein